MTAASGTREKWTRLATQRWPWIILLLLLALGYYGSYLRYGLGFRDEGQTVALLSQRLLHGEVPIKDVVLSYNVGWFWPVVALYKVFGVSYVLLRGWCFALSTLTAVLGFLLVAKTTRRPWLAFLVGVVLVLIPGSQFKNYIPLLAVANTLCLLHVALTPAEARRAFGFTGLAAIVLGLTFLIRIDIGFLFAALWLGFVALRVAVGTAPFGRRMAIGAASVAALIVVPVLVHVPVLIDARQRGYEREFAAQYLEKWRMLERPVTLLLRERGLLPAPKKRQASGHFQTPHRAALTPPAPEDAGADKQTLRRATLADLGKDGQNAGFAFVFLTYAPLLVLAVLVPWGVFTWIAGLRTRDGDRERRGLAVLVLLGGALTTFPQFFFFRPDVPHLSEFMPGFLASTFASVGLLGAAATWRNWRSVFGAFLIAYLAIYVVRILPDRWAGTYTIRHKRTKLFTAENGVRVYVSSREKAGLDEIQRLLREFAPDPRDYVVCYPYSPGINLLANRPTYEKNVYVDNATRTTRWDAEAIARFEKFRPAAIVLSDWDINGTKSSRFSVWAVQAKTWIQTNYIHQGTYIAGSDAFEIYTRDATPPPR